MATSTTFSTTFENTWTLVADGASIATCGVQLESTGPAVAVAIAASAPTAASDDYLILQPGFETSVWLDLNAADKLYARSQSATAKGKLRGVQVTR